MNNILFIDDEPHVLHTMKLAFRGENLNLFFAKSAVNALNIIKSKEISVIVSDNMMPGTSGVDLLSIVRKISPYSIRILLTGQCDEAAMVKSINKANIFQFIQKPFSARSIVELVKKSIYMYKESKLVGHLQKGNINLVQAIQRHSMNQMEFEAQWLSPLDVKENMTLLEDLKNPRGILLMKKGRRLNGKDISLIRSLGLNQTIAVKS